MKPEKAPRSGQGDLFKARLDQILNPKHGLFVLAGQMDSQCSKDAFGPLFV